MRTSIRDPEDTNPKRIVVPDLDLARYLQKQFPGSTVEWFDAGLEELGQVKRGGRPRIHESNAAKRRTQRSKAREAKVQRLRDIIQFVHDSSNEDCGSSSENNGAETSIGITIAIDTPVHFHGSIFSYKKAANALGYLSCRSVDDFVHSISSFHLHVIAGKEKNRLISPAMFDPSLSSKTDRGDENVVYCRHLFLDFEHGDLKPDEFAQLFPQYKMVITNSYRHTKENPRFRVIIPTSQQVSAEDHTLLFDQFREKLEDSGLSVGGSNIKSDTRRSGLDVSKRPASSLFYLPVQAENPENSFFKYYDEAGRQLLDPIQWIENAIVPIQPAIIPHYDNNRPTILDQSAADSAITEWQSTPPGGGNHAFFYLAWNLRKAGMDFDAIELTLRQQAPSGPSRLDRLRQIPDIIRWIREKESQWSTDG